MVSLLFAVDHVFQIGERGEIYTTGGKYPYEKWLEYLEIFDDVTVVSRGILCHQPENSLALSSGAGVRHHLLSGRKGVARLLDLPRYRAAVQALSAGSDCIIARLPGELGLSAAGAAQRLGKPYLVEVVACAWDAMFNHGSLAASIYAPLFMRKVQREVSRAPIAHYVTHGFLQERYPSNGAQFAGSDVILSEDAPNLEARKSRLRSASVGSRPWVVGSIGNMGSRLKGFDLAIKALAQQMPALNFQYRILGEGDDMWLRELAGREGILGRLSFDGTLPPGDPIFEWLDEIDVYLQPSYQEGMPRALLEAMSRGCLALASQVGGVPEVLPAERMHKVGDAKHLSSQLKRVISSDCARLEQEVEGNFAKSQRYHQRITRPERIKAYSALAAMCVTGNNKPDSLARETE